MGEYKTRKIEFREVVDVNDWKIKVYTISESGVFDHKEFYQNAIQKLPEWLAIKNGLADWNDKIGFLIFHIGKEGIFSLINWWVDTNMLNSHVFLTNPDTPDSFPRVSGSGIGPCVWELEIINHERISWTENIMKVAPPRYDAYLEDVISVEY